MSVTFTTEFVGTGRFIMTAWDYSSADVDEVVLADFPSYDEACASYEAVKAAHPTMESFYITAESAVDAPSVNVSNGNARDILIALNLPYEYDLCGSESGIDFLERVMLAMQDDRLDMAVPSFTEGGDGGATMVHGGREAGYVGGKLALLAEIAIFAKDLGLNVQWS